MKPKNSKRVCLVVTASAAFENHASFRSMDVSLMTQIRCLLTTFCADFVGLSEQGDQELTLTPVKAVPCKYISKNDKLMYFSTLERWREVAAEYYDLKPKGNGVKVLIAEADSQTREVTRAWELHELKPVVPSHSQLLAKVTTNDRVLKDARQVANLFRNHNQVSA